MAFTLPPPPTGNDPSSPAFRDWFYKLTQAFSTANSIAWGAITLPTVGANQFLAGPSSGTDATASFRTISTSDLGTGTANNTTYLRGDLTWATVSGGGTTFYNVLPSNTTIAADTSYLVIGDFHLNGYDLDVQGNLGVL